MCQVAVTNLATAHTTWCACLTSRECWEVVVKQEALVATCEHVVDKLLIKLGSQCHCSQRLSLTTCKDSASVRSRHIVGLAPNGANLVGLAAIHADALIKNHAAHCIALHVMEVAINHWSLLLTLLLGNGLDEVFENLIEAVVAPVLVGVASLSNVVAWLIALLANALLNLFIVNLMAILTLGNTELLGELLLCQAHRLNSVVSKL